MIVVVGEALMDLIVGDDRSVIASPGGGPFNTARAMGRLGSDVWLLGRISADPFGRILAKKLKKDGVKLVLPEPVDSPSALAVVEIEDQRHARYWFHVENTAAFDVADPAVLDEFKGEISAMHVGTLGLVVEPMATMIEQLVRRRSEKTLLMVDPNCRPTMTKEPHVFRSRLWQILPMTDILAVNQEDLDFIVPKTYEAISAFLKMGVTVVLVTDGPNGTAVHTKDGSFSVPGDEVAVVDSIGAGDIFGGAFLSWWTAHGLSRDELGDLTLLERAVSAATLAAAFSCERAGAFPPKLKTMLKSARWSDPL
jgi:fructokinase